MIKRDKTGIERCRKPIKTKKLDKIVRGVLIYWLVFVGLSWVTFWIKGSLPDTLVQYGLGGGAVELMITGFIEIARDKFAREGEKHDN